jgi:hypothetical protein
MTNDEYSLLIDIEHTLWYRLRFTSSRHGCIVFSMQNSRKFDKIPIEATNVIFKFYISGSFAY